MKSSINAKETSGNINKGPLTTQGDIFMADPDSDSEFIEVLARSDSPIGERELDNDEIESLSQQMSQESIGGDRTMATTTADIPDDRAFGGANSEENVSPQCSQHSTNSLLGIPSTEPSSRFSVGRLPLFAHEESNQRQSRNTRELSQDSDQPPRNPLLDSLADAVRHPFPLERSWPSELLTIERGLLETMACQSKSFSTIIPHINCEGRGITWSFVFPCTTGLPEKALQVIYFFDKMNGLSQHNPLNKYVVPTSNLRENLVPKILPGSKDVTGVVKQKFVDNDEPDTLQWDEDTVNLDNILSSGDGLTTRTEHTQMKIFEINVGFTAAIFTDQRQEDTVMSPTPSSTQPSVAPSISSVRTGSGWVDNEEKSIPFCIIAVNSLPNVDTNALIVNRFLAPAPEKSMNFEKIDEEKRRLRALFEEILIDQSSRMMNDGSGKRPSDFFLNPTGRLGIDKICNPFLDPLKICYYIQKNHIHVRDIQIIGYPDIDWQTDPRKNRKLRDYLQYSTAYIGHIFEAREKLAQALKEYHKEKDEPKRSTRRKKNKNGTFEEDSGGETHDEKSYPVATTFGWPVSVSRDFYTEFRSSLCPINMEFRCLCDTNIKQDFSLFKLGLGKLPSVVSNALHSLALYDHKNREGVNLSSILVKGADEKWNLSRVREEYYGANANLLDGIATPGCIAGTYKDILKHINESISKQEMTTEGAYRLLSNAINHGSRTYMSMIESGAFSSDRIKQWEEILKHIEKEEISGRLNFYSNLNEYANHLLSGTVDKDMRLNPYSFAQRILMACYKDTNVYKKLNAQNQKIEDELWCSMLMVMGSESKTIFPFGRLLILFPCCGTLKEQFQKEVFRKTDCPNSAGKDIVHKRITDIIAQFLESIGIYVSKQGFRVLTRFTPTALENQGALQFKDGKISSAPEENSNFSNGVGTEMRGDTPEATSGLYQTIINTVASRGEQQLMVIHTTVEGSDKSRKNVTKILVHPLMLCMMCSNQPTTKKGDDEKLKTISAVSPCTESGSTVYQNEDPNGDFNDFEQNQFECRSTPFEGITKKYAPLMMAGTHIMSFFEVVLKDWLGVAVPEISHSSKAFSDWMVGRIKEHLSPGLFHDFCKKNQIRRFTSIYESRTAAKTAWCKTIEKLLEYPDRKIAMQKAFMSFQFDALALSDVCGTMYELVRRCLNWGPIIYSSCFINEVKVPTVPISILVSLLNMDIPPLEGERSELQRWYDIICTWLFDCVHQQRFCPASHTSETVEFCEYISSNGTDFGTKSGQGVFRTNQAQSGWKDPYDKKTAQTQLAKEMFEVYGEELYNSCSITENSIVQIVDDVFSNFVFSVQKLIGVNLHTSEKYLKFFGIWDQVPRWKLHSNPRVTPPFAIKAAWIRGEETLSLGVGFHFIQILIEKALIGNFDKLHPQIVSNLTEGLLKEILKNAPAGAIPSNNIYVTRFDCFTGEHQPIILEDNKDQIEHFLRPKNTNFADTGKLPDCLNYEQFAPEDILHMGPNCECARILGCDIDKVPASADVTYSIRKNKYYCIYNRLEDLMGYLCYDGDTISVMYSGTTDPDLDCATSLSIERWNTELGEKGFIMLPMIWRDGACVRVRQDEKDLVGCIVPPPPIDSDGEPISSDGNFCYNIKSYYVNMHCGEKIPMHVKDVLKDLLPIGTMLFIKCESQTAAPLIRRLKVALPTEEKSSHALRAFLTGPDCKRPVAGKVYVAYLVKSAKGASGEITCFDPWELLIEPGSRNVFKDISA